MGAGAAEHDRRRELVGQTTRLVEFLRELARTGKPVVRNIEDHPLVRWLADLPDEVLVLTEAGPGDTVMSIEPVVSEPPPVPPPDVARWIDHADVQDSSLEAPQLSEEIPDSDWPDVDALYWPWLDGWQAWAEGDRRVAPRRAWHADLLRVARQLEQQDDRYEVVIGTGLVTWRVAGAKIRHPLITTRLDVIADQRTGRVDVMVPEDAVTRINDRWLLDGLPGYDPTIGQNVRDEVRARLPVPLGDDLKDPLTRWQSSCLDRCQPYAHEWRPSEPGTDGPEVTFAPVLVLRERDRTSLIDYLDRMLEALSGPDATAPLGLAQLLTAVESDERMRWLESEGAASGSLVGDDPLFPLPANPEQRRIIDRLRTDNGVVVMGPPGTGKTHTIANLVSALLARGQRVLVTSQKAQALRVLRDQMPDAIQKLCVSMTDVARGGSNELNESVTALSDRYSQFSEGEHEQKLRRLASKREAARAQVAALKERIRALREAETYVHPPVASGYEGTRARIAERLRQHAAACDWMPVPFPADAPVRPPLEVGDLLELRRLVIEETPERRARVEQTLPDVGALPSPVEIEGLVHAERAAHDSARGAATDLSEALAGADDEGLAGQRVLVDAGQASLHALGLVGDPASWPDRWTVRAIVDGLARQDWMLWQQVAESAGHADVAHSLLQPLGLRQVTLPSFAATGPDSLAGQLHAGRALRVYLEAGGHVKRRLRPAVQRQAQLLLDGAFVDGLPISNAELLGCVLAVLEAEQTATGLAARWATVDVHIDPGLPLDRRVSQLRDLASDLCRVVEFVRARDDVETRLRGHGVQISLRTPIAWDAFVAALAALEARLAADRATSDLADLASRLDLAARGAGAPPEMTAMARAIAERDPSAYEDALRSLADAPGQQGDQRRCLELDTTLGLAHPTLAGEFRRTVEDEVWYQRFASFDEAWAWGKARTVFDELRVPGLEERLAIELQDAIDREGRATSALAAELAWGECLTRMTAHQQQALLSYKAQIDTRGKGTGKWAHLYTAAAREAMIEAREAVPAWIMPIGDVVDTVPPDKNSFDVVIVDEASQASIEALFLLWLAPRVIVVGDERQCAPSAVVRGELQPIFDRLDTYLGDLPRYLRTMFTPKTDLFSLLQTRFGATIRLREHFRCMPEIIGWSSKQFYADAPLVPLRQFGANRLRPLRVVHIPDAVNEGTSTGLRNRAEAEAIVEQIARCVDDPAYGSRSIGVVVLQGTGQVHLIDELLEQRLPAEVRESRRIRVGSPPDFQGDQRDVVFLSMVAAERRSSFTSREWQRRFNVAASRARDQMWLFHSVTLDLLAPADLRRSLLGYMLNPPAPLSTGTFDDLRWDSPRREPFESMFEQRVFIALRDRGYAVTPQYEVNDRRIDLVVTGAKGRLAVECDGDHWHSRPEDQLADLDREQELARAGWRFWRLRESEFYLDPEDALASLWTTLDERGIRPGDLSGHVDDSPNPAPALPWSPNELSVAEGIDGLDGADPSELEADPRGATRDAGTERPVRAGEGRGRGSAMAPRTSATDAASSMEVRSWARARGMRVGDRGRLNPRVIQEWNRANPDRPIA